MSSPFAPLAGLISGFGQAAFERRKQENELDEQNREALSQRLISLSNRIGPEEFPTYISLVHALHTGKRGKLGDAAMQMANFEHALNLKRMEQGALNTAPTPMSMGAGLAQVIGQGPQQPAAPQQTALQNIIANNPMNPDANLPKGIIPAAPEFPLSMPGMASAPAAQPATSPVQPARQGGGSSPVATFRTQSNQSVAPNAELSGDGGLQPPVSDLGGISTLSPQSAPADRPYGAIAAPPFAGTSGPIDLSRVMQLINTGDPITYPLAQNVISTLVAPGAQATARLGEEKALAEYNLKLRQQELQMLEPSLAQFPEALRPGIRANILAGREVAPAMTSLMLPRNVPGYVAGTKIPPGTLDAFGSPIDPNSVYRTEQNLLLGPSHNLYYPEVTAENSTVQPDPTSPTGFSQVYKNRAGQEVYRERNVLPPRGLLGSSSTQTTDETGATHTERTPVLPNLTGIKKDNQSVLNDLKNQVAPYLSQSAPGQPFGGKDVLPAGRGALPNLNTSEAKAMMEGEKRYNTEIAPIAKANNTALEHLELLDQAYEMLHNGNIVPANQILNRIGSAFGLPARTAYDTIAQRVGQEINSAYVKGGGGEREREYGSGQLSSSLSPDQFKTNVRALVDLMAAQQDNLEFQYKQDTFGRGRRELFTPNTKRIKEKYLGGGGGGAQTFVEGDTEYDIPADKVAAFKAKHPNARPK